MKLFRFLTVLLLVLALSLFTQLASAQDVNLLIQQGREAFHSGEYDEAEDLLRQATQMSPDSVDALMSLSIVLWYQVKLDEAIAVVQQATQLDPNNRLASLWLEQMVEEQRSAQIQIDSASTKVTAIFSAIDAAIPLIDSIRADIQEAPNAPRTYYSYVYLGDILLQQNREVEELIEAIRRLRELVYSYTNTYRNLTSLTAEQNRLDEAIVAYGNAIRLRPDVIDVYYKLGNALYERGEFAEAISAYQEVIQREPQDVFAEDRIREIQLRLEQNCEY